MLNIVIPTIPDDMHAAAVALVLERMGHRALRWFCADFPQQRSVSLALGPWQPTTLLADEAMHTAALQQIDVFWNRRLASPLITQPMLQADRQFALRESSLFMNGVLTMLSDSAFAVNPMREAGAAENKCQQLVAARELGFALPPTLVSNDPQQIRRFLHEHRAVGTVFKSFRPVTWESADRLAMLYTARVTADMLPDDETLRLAPGIFQAYVPKAFELRVTCMGDEVIAAKLDSQATRHGRTDWRLQDLRDMRVQPYTLPADIELRCRALLKRMGLVFGCMDFIVTPSGEHVFLENNQMGQFLWVEETCPELPMLQTFCDFLVSRDPHFRRGRKEPLHFADVLAEASALLSAERGTHLQPERQTHVVQE